MKRARSDRRLAEPLEELELVDGDDLATLALALDEVATLLAAHPALADVVDVDTEPLDSLIARAAEVAGIDDGTVESWVDQVAELAEAAQASRYDSDASTEEIERAKELQEELIAALDDLEGRLG